MVYNLQGAGVNAQVHLSRHISELSITESYLLNSWQQYLTKCTTCFTHNQWDFKSGKHGGLWKIRKSTKYSKTSFISTTHTNDSCIILQEQAITNRKHGANGLQQDMHMSHLSKKIPVSSVILACANRSPHPVKPLQSPN